jgi:hypothetical protein
VNVLPDPTNPAWLIEQFRQYRHPDYALYIRPWPAGQLLPEHPHNIVTEALIAAALSPLPMAVLPRPGEPCAPDATLPSGPDQYREVFRALTHFARLIFVVPSDKPELAAELSELAAANDIWRCVFWMPAEESLANVDWLRLWPTFEKAFAASKLRLPPYTPGGWFFRYDPDGRSCAFRILTHPSKEKVAKALESIASEMQPPPG